MYFKRRGVLSWDSLSGAAGTAEMRARAARLPRLPARLASWGFSLPSFTIRRCYFKMTFNRSCGPGRGWARPRCRGACHTADTAQPRRQEEGLYHRLGRRLAEASGIPLAAPRFYCKEMIHLSALATNLDHQGNARKLSEKLEHKIRSRGMMNE